MGSVRYSNPAALATGASAVPESQLARAGDLVIVADQIGVAPAGDVRPGLTAQLETALDRIRLALESEGLTMHDVLSFRKYLTGAALLPQFYVARGEDLPLYYADDPYPANTLVVVAALVRPELLVEVEGVAVA